MKHDEGFRNEALSRALDGAVAGKPLPLYDLLARASGLPGTRINRGILDAFSVECAARGKKVDRLVREMIQLEADRAPGGTELEVLPVCGVYAVAARAVSEPTTRKAALGLLHDASDDFRFRVREAVPVALASIGQPIGDTLLHEVGEWMDGFFHAAAVLLAIATPSWLGTLKEEALVLERLDQGFSLLRNATRASSRYPGYKALVDALLIAPREVAIRFGTPAFDQLVAWTKEKDPALRDLIHKAVESPKITGRFSSEIVRVKAALKGTDPLPRDPTLKVQGTRGRGRKAKRR